MHVAMYEIDFSAYVLTTGDGTAGQHPQIKEDMIKLPQEYLVDTLDALIQRVFPNISDGYSDKYFVVWQAILTPKMIMMTRSMKSSWRGFQVLGKHICLLIPLVKMMYIMFTLLTSTTH